MGRVRLGPPTLLVACVAYQTHIPGPFPFAWILLLPGGSFQYGIVVPGKKSESESHSVLSDSLGPHGL